MKFIVNLSGGKDSTAMLLMLLERDYPIDYIIYADTGKDFPQMQKHLEKLSIYIAENYPQYNSKIYVLRDSRTFDYYMFEHIKTRGKNKGKRGYGWATMRARWCTSNLKTSVIEKWVKYKCPNEDYIHYVGIAADEPSRLKDDKHKSYPLAQWGVTESEALTYCYNKGFDWDGLYNHFDRVSCWCCPLKNLKELKALYQYYPDLWERLKEMDKRAYNQFRADYSVEELEKKFKQEIKKNV